MPLPTALPLSSSFLLFLCLMAVSSPSCPVEVGGKVKKATENVSYCHCHRLCHLPSAEKCQSAKVCSKIHKISVRPSALSLCVLFVYVAVCLFLFLWLFLSAKITDKRCWSKWESPICMSVVLKCCARRLLYMALLSMSVSRHQCVCVICGGREHSSLPRT